MIAPNRSNWEATWLVVWPAFASRIDQLIEAFGVKPEEVEIEQVTLEKPITEIIAEAEHRLSEIEKETETTGLTDGYSLMQKMRT